MQYTIVTDRPTDGHRATAKTALTHCVARYLTASVQSAQTEPWSLCTPLFDQLIHNALLESSPSLKQMLLQLWQNEVTWNILLQRKLVKVL